MNHMTKIGVALVALSIALTGCSTTKNWLGKRNNGSLDYQQSQKSTRLSCLPIKRPLNSLRCIKRQILAQAQLT